MTRKADRPGFLLRARGGWLAIAVVVAAGVAGVGVLPAAAISGAPARAAGTISTVAGGVGGPARATTVALTPCGVTWAGGSLYTGTGNAVRKVSTAGRLTTPAGTGSRGPSGNLGPAVRASLNGACGVAVDRSGNLVIADAINNRVQVVAAATGTFYGRAMTATHIYSVAGTGRRGFSGDGGPATSAELFGPSGVAVDRAGNLVIADTRNERVRVAAAATGTFYGQPMTAGHIYTIAGTGRRGFTGDGGPGTSAELWQPSGVAIDGAGNLVIADTRNNRVRVVAAATGSFYGQPMIAGHIYTIAGTGHLGFTGDGGPATSAELFGPSGVAVDGADNLLVADTGNNRVRVVAAATGTFYGQAMTAGHIYTIAGNGTGGFSGDGGPATSAELNFPEGMTLDTHGNVVVADNLNNRVRVVAAATGTFYGQAMTAGHIYTIAGTGTGGFSRDGGPGTSAEISQPSSVAVDGSGNLLIADSNNNRIREVAAEATVVGLRWPVAAQAHP